MVGIPSAAGPGASVGVAKTPGPSRSDVIPPPHTLRVGTAYGLPVDGRVRPSSSIGRQTAQLPAAGLRFAEGIDRTHRWTGWLSTHEPAGPL
eukprot:COSAG01_NODE_3585_length_5907_cov_21.750689_2_plen_92_part_00